MTFRSRENSWKFESDSNTCFQGIYVANAFISKGCDDSILANYGTEGGGTERERTNYVEMDRHTDYDSDESTRRCCVSAAEKSIWEMSDNTFRISIDHLTEYMGVRSPVDS